MELTDIERAVLKVALIRHRENLLDNMYAKPAKRDPELVDMLRKEVLVSHAIERKLAL